MRKKGASLVRSLRVVKYLVFARARKIIKSTRISHVTGYPAVVSEKGGHKNRLKLKATFSNINFRLNISNQNIAESI